MLRSESSFSSSSSSIILLIERSFRSYSAVLLALNSLLNSIVSSFCSWLNSKMLLKKFEDFVWLFALLAEFLITTLADSRNDSFNDLLGCLLILLGSIGSLSPICTIPRLRQNENN